MPRCCVVTAYRNSEYATLAEITLPRMRAFADRHGHELRVHRMEASELDRAWIKVPPILDALNGDFDFVVWFDIDALILRFDHDILDLARPNADLLISWHEPETAQPGCDGESTFPPHYNAGVYLIRRSDWSRDFFARMLGLRGQIDHGWSDQATLHAMLGLNRSLGFGPDLADIPDRLSVGRLDLAWNSIPGIAMADDPVVLHFAGFPHDTRLRLMESTLAMLDFYETGHPALRSALARQLSLWARAERQAHENSHHRQTVAHLQADLARLRDPRQLARAFPGAIVRRLAAKLRVDS